MNLDEALIFVGALTLRTLLSSHPHSGEGRPPMYGDYEAQRHWQEVTVNLPMQSWYRNSSDNDLMYWGLDYPPLTAYHSYLVGKTAQAIEPSFVSLHSSRGVESPEHKVFMRTSVLALDALLYLPAAATFARVASKGAHSRGIVGFALLALYPGLILMDNGHFQYNNASLGLFLLSVTCLLARSDLVAAFFFACALNYKQMELYHALPIFCCLLGSALREQPTVVRSLAKVAALGSVVVSTFALIWWPFLAGGTESAGAVLGRIFPVARGVFEDKVANFWCTINLVVKIREAVPEQSRMLLLCGLATLAATLPSCLHLLARPSRSRNLPLALTNTALAFFLFSFQVHEKSILLVAIPTAMVAAQVDREGQRFCPAACAWLLLVSVFSMTPLLVKDGLLGAALALSSFFLIGCRRVGMLSPVAVSAPSPVKKRVLPIAKYAEKYDWLFYSSMVTSLSGCLVLAALSSLVPSPFPDRYPDLWAVLVSAYSCAHFLAFAAYFNYVQLSCGGDYYYSVPVSHTISPIRKKKKD